MNSTVWMALAIVLIIEGVGPMFMPKAWREFLLRLTQTPEPLLRRIGGGLVVAGMVIFFMANR